MYALSNNPKTNIRGIYGLEVRKIEEGGEMKQHITITDLKMLSEGGKEQLRSWWISTIRECDVYIDLSDPVQLSTVSCCEDELCEDDYPLLSIGQMIEFLDEHLETESDTDFCILENKGWSVGHYHHNNGPDCFDFTTSLVYKDGNYIQELCDALWKACVEVLNNHADKRTTS